jgi:hypothetical protein
MDLWTILEYAAWALCAIFAVYMVADLVRIDSRYSNELLTSSREGDFEAAQEHHKVEG